LIVPSRSSVIVWSGGMTNCTALRGPVRNSPPSSMSIPMVAAFQGWSSELRT
jgi:hypothetical protein